MSPFNWWNDEAGVEPAAHGAQGHGRRRDDFRIIFKSDQIVNSPMAYLADLPADLKAAIHDRGPRRSPTKDPAAFEKIYEGKQGPWQPVDNKAYEPIIELNKFVDDLRKKKRSS